MFSAVSLEGGVRLNETWQGLIHPALIPISEGSQGPTDKKGRTREMAFGAVPVIETRNALFFR